MSQKGAGLAVVFLPRLRKHPGLDSKINLQLLDCRIGERRADRQQGCVNPVKMALRAIGRGIPVAFNAWFPTDCACRDVIRGQSDGIHIVVLKVHKQTGGVW